MTLHHAPFTPLSKQAVADLLDISIRSVENWINEGILPAPAKLGNRVFWHPDAFYGWLSQRLLEPVLKGKARMQCPLRANRVASSRITSPAACAPALNASWHGWRAANEHDASRAV